MVKITRRDIIRLTGPIGSTWGEVYPAGTVWVADGASIHGIAVHGRPHESSHCTHDTQAAAVECLSDRIRAVHAYKLAAVDRPSPFRYTDEEVTP